MASTAANVTVLPSTEDKVLQAAEESTQIIAAFSPQVAMLVQAGIAVEPLVSGLGKLVIGHFLHHTKKGVPSNVTPQN